MADVVVLSAENYEYLLKMARYGAEHVPLGGPLRLRHLLTIDHEATRETR